MQWEYRYVAVAGSNRIVPGHWQDICTANQEGSVDGQDVNVYLNWLGSQGLKWSLAVAVRIGEMPTPSDRAGFHPHLLASAR